MGMDVSLHRQPRRPGARWTRVSLTDAITGWINEQHAVANDLLELASRTTMGSSGTIMTPPAHEHKCDEASTAGHEEPHRHR